MTATADQEGSLRDRSEAMIVACLGSSSTAGKGQAFDWIGELDRRPQSKNIVFRNFGVGGDLAYNALQRVGAIVDSHPAKILVWVGGNDALAMASPKLRRFFRFWKRLPRDPSPEWFRESACAIVERLQRETRASVALCSLPPIGEDLSASHPVQREINRCVAECNAIIAAIAREQATSYLPLNEAIAAELATLPGKAFTSFALLPFYRDAFRALVLGRSADDIAAANGWRLHSDGIHLNRRAGLIVADVVQAFLVAGSRTEHERA
jgi:lysophospholipase L1-like esterase